MTRLILTTLTLASAVAFATTLTTDTTTTPTNKTATTAAQNTNTTGTTTAQNTNTTGSNTTGTTTNTTTAQNTTNPNTTSTTTNTTGTTTAQNTNTTSTTTGTNMTNNTNTSEDFLTQNAKKADVQTLPDGLQYKVIENGTGQIPTKTSTVTVHYAGTLTDGTEFDSSYKRGQPATFRLDQVIKGWTEALSKMKAGSTWMLYIPPSLAYGSQGIPGVIPPNSVLVFKVQLISVDK